MTLRETLNYDVENGNLILGLGFSSKLSNKVGELSAYAGICGSYYDGVHQWMTHNIDSWDECANEKYTGYTVFAEDAEVYRLVIENRIMDLEVKDWKHAKNLFTKYLRTV